jgi:spermidine synthase
MPKLLLLLFAASGAAGLVYQVAWVRLGATVLGSSVYAVSTVTAVFMAGLGLGAWLGGGRADRHPGRALRDYGLVELGVAATGLSLAFLLPAAAPLAAAIPAGGLDSHGWHVPGAATHLLRAMLAGGLLFPSTLLMGSTLPLLVRHVVVSPSGNGSKIGWLYGANTAGAAAGAVGADLVLVPGLGLFGAQMVAVAASAAVGLVALVAAQPDERVQSVSPALFPVRGAVALALAGTAALGVEIVWFRFLGGALGPYRAVFAVLLAVVLAAMGLGSALSAAALRRGVSASSAFALSQTAFAVLTLVGLATFDPEAVVLRQLAVAERYLVAGPLSQAALLHGVNAATIAVLALLPAVAMGGAFPLVNALVQDDAEQAGRRTGWLYLATAAGNVLGALGTGFFLLPWLGMQGSVLWLSLVALAAPLVVRPGRWGVGLVAVSTAVALWFAMLPTDHVLWRSFPAGRGVDEPLLEVREGLETTAVVTGTLEGPARLWTSGHPMTSTTPHAQRYMRLLSHLPLLMQTDPRRVLVIGFGAGNTTHAASLHPGLERIEVADLSHDILEMARHFRHANRDVLADPRVAVFVEDGRHHLLRQQAGYDLIVLEPPPLAAAGVSSLYAAELYALARDRLTPTGMVATWLPAYQVPESAVRSLVRSFVDGFDDAVLLAGSGRELLLVGGASVAFDPAAVEARLTGAVAQDLERVGAGSWQELALTFAADRDTLVRATAASPPVTDNRPLLENSQISHLMTTELPADLFDTTRIGSWCADCGDLQLLAGLELTGALYRSDAFLHYSSLVPDLTSLLPAPDTEDQTLATLAASSGLRRVVVAADALAIRAAELHAEGRMEEARAHLSAAQEQVDLDLFKELEAAWFGD